MHEPHGLIAESEPSTRPVWGDRTAAVVDELGVTYRELDLAINVAQLVLLLVLLHAELTR